MADYIEVSPGLVVTEDGEIVEAAGIDDPLKFVVIARAEAKGQVNEWSKRVDVLDAVIKRRQADRSVVYGDIVSTIRGGTYSKTDSPTLAAAIVAPDSPLADAFDFEHADKVETVLGLIGAASGFRKDDVPDGARALYQEHTAELPKRSWVETSAVRKSAPKRVTRAASEADE